MARGSPLRSTLLTLTKRHDRTYSHASHDLACGEGGRPSKTSNQGVAKDSERSTVQGDETGRERRAHDRTNSHAVGKEANE
jgi:hypothetical protein